MAWNIKKYTRINWRNRPSTATALGATNLNKMDVFLNEVDNGLIEFEASKLNIAVANTMIQSLTIDPATGVIKATQLDGTVHMWDLNIEKIPIAFTLSEDGVLTMTTADGTVFSVNIAELITAYLFDDSSTIGFTNEFRDEAYHVSAIVKNGSLKQEHFDPDFAAEIQSDMNAALGAASDSLQYSKDSKRWAVGHDDYEGSATDNSKYYSQQSQSEANRAEASADLAAAYSSVVAPTFRIDWETMQLIQESAATGMDFYLDENKRLFFEFTV